MNPELINGKVIAITGGGAGLGLATAQVLVKFGAKVALLGRRQDVLDKAVAELGTEMPPVLSVMSPKNLRWKKRLLHCMRTSASWTVW